MRTQGIRRLPVVNSGALAGIRCLNEIALNAKKVGALSCEDVVETVQAVCEQRIARHAVAVA